MKVLEALPSNLASYRRYNIKIHKALNRKKERVKIRKAKSLRAQALSRVVNPIKKLICAFLNN